MDIPCVPPETPIVSDQPHTNQGSAFEMAEKAAGHPRLRAFT